MVYNNIQPQQTANNTQRLMKRRSNSTPLRTCLFFSHPFVGRYAFVERLFRVYLGRYVFVERLFRAYLATYQYVIYKHQQFNAFLPLNKSAGETTEANISIRRQVGRTSILPTDKGKPMSLTKRKRRKTPTDNIADTATGFWEAKSHSSLGRFLHAPLTLTLKTPQ